jgi:hypothetical protein
MAAKRGGAQAKQSNSKVKQSNSKAKKSVVDSIDTAAAALNKAEVKQLKFDPLFAKTACDTGLKLFKPHRGELKAKYSSFNLDELDELPVIADRLRAVQRRIQTASGAAGSLESILEGLSWRGQLMPIAESLAKANKVDQKKVGVITRGRGQSDNVQDVLDLVALLTDHRAVVEAIAGANALTSATNAANRALGKQGTTGELDADAVNRRDRYATLLTQRHDRLRSAYAAVTSFAEALEQIPALRSGGSVKKQPEPPAPPQ